MNRRYPKRSRGPSPEPPANPRRAERADPETPFALRIHPQVRQVLAKIRVPEPTPFVPDPFQTQAIDALAATDVLVTAPTGAGKTYIAVEAIQRVFGGGGRSWYASPLKALSNAKFEEFAERFGADNIGILTGDRKENTHAPILVGTTEILRNQLYDAMHSGEDLGIDLVVLDEAHYLGDEDRGVVWEEVLIYLPARVRLLLLSATIRNGTELCTWLGWLRGQECRWIAAGDRPVPLVPLFAFPDGNLTPLSSKRRLFPKIAELDRHLFSRRDFPPVSRLLDTLKQTDLLPTIFFLKSRSDCERSIELCPAVDRRRAGQLKPGFHRRLQELLERWPFLRRHKQLALLERARVGAHHGGQLPHWKLLLETLMQEGYLEAIFSTSTVAAGVNFPARTVVILQSDRFNGREFIDISATELLQMTGRAGRRGMDEIGFVLVVPGYFQNPQLLHDLLRSPPDPILSRLRVNFSMVLNLLLSHQLDEIQKLFSSSLATFQDPESEGETRGQIEALQRAFEPWLDQMACAGPGAMVELRPQALALRERRQRAARTLKRHALLWSTRGLMTPGRLFLSRHGTLYVVVESQLETSGRIAAVRLRAPLQWRQGAIHARTIEPRRILELGEKLAQLPEPTDRDGWKKLAMHLAETPFKAFATDTGSRQPSQMRAASQELREIALQLSAMPCANCAVHGPCLKATGHPLSLLVQDYVQQAPTMQSTEDTLWRSFQHHYRLLRQEGYIDADGHLTADGQWASKLRLDQPILISEGIRHQVFPADDPALLAALVAPFVMDRDRPGETDLATMVARFPDLARPYFRMLQQLQRLRELLREEGFALPNLPFWTVATVHLWARGESWENIGQLTGIDEGDLAMVMLRTADHLRQIEALHDIPGLEQLAATATAAIKSILREPVLMR